MLREQKMEKVLSPLTGKKREQMAFVLQNVETQKLEEAYKFFIGRVLKEEDSSSSTAAVITEAAAPKAEATVLVTGEEQITEEVAAPASTQSSAALAQLKRLAGLK